MRNWDDVTLGDCIEFLNGFAFKSKFFTNNKDDIALVKGENLGKGQVLWEASKYWNKNDEGKLYKYILKAGDLLLAMDRPWVGGGLKYAYIKKDDPKAFLVQRVGCIRSNPRAFQLFIRYVIASETFSQYVKGIMGGVGVPHISPTQIKSYKFAIPPLPTQRKIASILSAYDDLIENNLKRIKLFEEIAQRTYEEWFVKFRINGKQLKINKETGLPEGWEEKPLNSIVEIISGYPFKSSEYISDGVYKIVTIKNVQDGFFVPITTDTLAEVPSKVKSEQKLETGDIIISLTGNVGRICLVYGENYLLNQRVAKLIPLNGANKCFVYSLLRSKTMITKLENLSNGAAQQNLSPINMGNMNICIPKDDVLMQFSKLMDGTIELICKLNLHNTLLKESRDILLPRLMSGAVSVSN